MNDLPRLLSALQPGSPLFLEAAGLRLRLRSVLVGVRPGRFLLATVPHPPEPQTQMVASFFYEGNTITCYTLLDGVAVAFDSKLIRLLMSPFPLLFLTYPQDMKTSNVRQHTRINCLYEAVLHAAKEKVRGLITDLSQGGCGFVFQKQGDAQAIDLEKPVILESWQLGAVEDDAVLATVRSNSTAGDTARLGLKFESVTEKTLDTLERLVVEALELGKS